MKKRWFAAMLILLITLVSVLPISAQGVVNISIDELVLDAHPETETWVTVFSENGVPISGLGPQNFEIVEDGMASFPPSSVTTQVNSDVPISVVMVIDISGSMRGKPINEAINAANALIDQLSPGDRAAIIAFADEIDIDAANIEEGTEVAFTTDKNALRNVVNFLDQKIGWDTPLYDAIYKGVKMVAAEPPGKRAVVVMTDGRDERDNAQGKTIKDAGSLVSPDDPISEANRRNIPVFSIGLVGLGGTDTKYLNRLAERTGAVYQQAPEPEELTPLFENVVNQLKEQYVLTYNSRIQEDENPHSSLVRAQIPQGQGYAEVKFRFGPEPVATVPPPSSPTGVEAATQAPVSTEPSSLAEVSPSPGLVEPTPETTPGESQGLVQKIVDVFKENPLLGTAIGAGMLLLIVLIIALLIVLLRGPRDEEQEYDSLEYDPTYDPTGGAWPAKTDSPGVPMMEAPTEGAVEQTPTDWPGTTPATQLADQPFTGPSLEAGIPPAGGTRLIQRQPKHVALLVDKARPSQKYDLQAITNVGRAQDSEVVLSDPTVSRHHAWIKLEGEDFVVFDIGSANGTYVNDEKIQDPRQLEHGDVVRFGDAALIFTRVT